MSHASLRVLAFTSALALALPPLALAQDKAAKPTATEPAATKKAAPAATKKAPAKKAPKLDPKTQAQLSEAKKMLASNEKSDVEAAIQSLGLLGVPAAVDPLVERIQKGLPNDLLETSIVTLMALGQPSAGPALFELARYRRPAIRKLSIEAIAAVRPSGGEAVLVAALNDAETEVRSAAAVGLGEIGSPGSIDTLFLALDHGNMEAATAIGKLVPARDVKRLFGYLGKVPFRSLAPAFAETLKRKDVAENDKLAIVARLEEVGTGEVKGFFNDLMASTSGGLPPNVSKAVLRAMAEISGS
jgi:HEAT repeat protein